MKEYEIYIQFVIAALRGGVTGPRVGFEAQQALSTFKTKYVYTGGIETPWRPR